MIPQKNNPSSIDLSEKYNLTILNNLISFVLKINHPDKGVNLSEEQEIAYNRSLSELENFKIQTIKIIDCIKFIKVNLPYIGYAVENRHDARLYTYEGDKGKGVIRDFNGTALHFNSYHTRQAAQDGLKSLVEQIESAAQTMGTIGKLEEFVRRFQVSDVGCIEARTASALSFAATTLSSTSPNLDQLIEVCPFLNVSDDEALFEKVKEFLNPFMGKNCIWQNKDYVLNGSLIKQYLKEIFFINLPSEEENIKEILENLSISEKIKWLRQFDYSESSYFLLEEIQKINKLNFSLKERANLFKLRFFLDLSQFHHSPKQNYLSLSIAIVIIITLLLTSTICVPFLFSISLFTNDLIASFLTILLFVGNFDFEANISLGEKIFNDSLIFTIWIIPCLISYTLAFLFITVRSLCASSSSHLHHLLGSKINLLIEQYIDDYFDAKVDFPSENLRDFLKDCLLKKQALNEKEKYFLDKLSGKIQENEFSNEIDITAVLEKGIQSWDHYRYLRKQDHPLMQTTLNYLLSTHRLFKGCQQPFLRQYLQSIATPSANQNALLHFDNNFREKFLVDNNNFLKVEKIIEDNKALAKVILEKNWSLMFDQLASPDFRPALRKSISNPKYKFVHLTGEIIPYHKKDKLKRQYCMTKKMSTTLISAKKHTQFSYISEESKSNLVALLFDRNKCKVKAMLKNSSATYHHNWIDKKQAVSTYKDSMENINFIDEKAFIDFIGKKTTLLPNEVLAKVSKEALSAIVIPKDTFEGRLYAISIQRKIRKIFSIDLPLIFYSPEQKLIKHYSLLDQGYDLSLLESKIQNLQDAENEFFNKENQGSFLCNRNTSDDSVPKTKFFLSAEIEKLKNLKMEEDFYAQQQIIDKIKSNLIKKYTSSTFFRALSRCSEKTINYKKIANSL